VEDSNGLGVGKNGAKHITDDEGAILHNRLQWLKLSGLQGLTFCIANISSSNKMRVQANKNVGGHAAYIVEKLSLGDGWQLEYG
jgi:hypothetical protein